jgi:hypothetical protein
LNEAHALIDRVRRAPEPAGAFLAEVDKPGHRLAIRNPWAWPVSVTDYLRQTSPLSEALVPFWAEQALEVDPDFARNLSRVIDDAPNLGLALNLFALGFRGRLAQEEGIAAGLSPNSSSVSHMGRLAHFGVGHLSSVLNTLHFHVGARLKAASEVIEDCMEPFRSNSFCQKPDEDQLCRLAGHFCDFARYDPHAVARSLHLLQRGGRDGVSGVGRQRLTVGLGHILQAPAFGGSGVGEKTVQDELVRNPSNWRLMHEFHQLGLVDEAALENVPSGSLAILHQVEPRLAPTAPTGIAGAGVTTPRTARNFFERAMERVLREV